MKYRALVETVVHVGEEVLDADWRIVLKQFDGNVTETRFHYDDWVALGGRRKPAADYREAHSDECDWTKELLGLTHSSFARLIQYQGLQDP